MHSHLLIFNFTNIYIIEIRIHLRILGQYPLCDGVTLCRGTTPKAHKSLMGARALFCALVILNTFLKISLLERMQEFFIMATHQAAANL